MAKEIETNVKDVIKRSDNTIDNSESKKIAEESENKILGKESKLDIAQVNTDSKNKKESRPAVEKISKIEKKDKAEIELERVYIVPLKKGVLNVPRYRRAKKAIRVLKEFMVRHMGIRDRDLGKVKIDINLNNEIWFRGIKKPMNKIKVKAKKIDGIVYVELAEVPKIISFKIIRETKRKSAIMKTKKNKIVKEKIKTEKEEKEEKEAIKAGTEMDTKIEKSEVKTIQHATKGAHVKKAMPTRKILKK